MPPSEEEIDAAARALREGEVVGFPTETVYGLGANALLPAAVRKIYELKGRPSNNPLIVHVAEVSQIASVAEVEPGSLIELRLNKISKLWPGPLTVILPKKSPIASEVTAGWDSVGVRIPSHPVARALLAKAGVPVAAPSANRSNAVSPTTVEHVRAAFGDALKFLLDGGPCAIGLESTVVSLLDSSPKILRPGAISAIALEDVLGEKVDEVAPLHGPLRSPGLLPTHYAPKTKLYFLPEGPLDDSRPQLALLAFTERTPSDAARFQEIRYASRAGDLEEVARNLYSCLHELDEKRYDAIYVDQCDKAGLGAAIMDRLRRAVQ